MLAGATIVRFAVVTPSDHVRKSCFPRSVCGEGALSELLDPVMTVREKGETLLTPLNVNLSPVGLVWKFNVVVLGSTRILVLLRKPEASVAVRVSSSSDG